MKKTLDTRLKVW